jgi:hypothetical protein
LSACAARAGSGAATRRWSSRCCGQRQSASRRAAVIWRLRRLLPAAPRASGQLAAKGRLVAEALERIGGILAGALAAAAGRMWGYRRRRTAGLQARGREGKVFVGFRERGSPFLADLEVREVLRRP